MGFVIKSGQLKPSGTTSRTAKFNFEDMAETATRYLESVRKSAQQILDQAQQQAKATIDQARRHGEQQGRVAAQQAALAELDTRWNSLRPALEQAVDSVQQLRHAWVRQWEQNAVRLVMAVAERLVRGELSRRPEISRAWTREALELAAGSATVSLHLNPADYESLGRIRDEVAESLRGLFPSHIVPDPEIEPGGCRVVTEHGHIDHQLRSQLARIEEELMA